MTQTSYDPSAPASEDTRPLAVLVGNGSGCHECGRSHVGVIKIGRHRAPHCEFHAAIVEKVMKMQLGMWSYVTARDAR